MLTKAGEGLDVRSIAAWLKAEHGVGASPAAVQRLLGRRREERAVITEAVLRETIGPVIVDDLASIDVNKRLLEGVIPVLLDTSNLETFDPQTAIKAIEGHRKIVETKFKFSGARSAAGGEGPRGPVINIPPETDD